jgi:single-strand DNA-binding protein
MSVNQVFLIGRLGADPELKYTKGGKAICTFSLATDRWSSDAATESGPDWHSVVAWERQAETCSRYLKRGRQVAVEGRLSRRKYQDAEGRDRYWVDVVARQVHFLGGGDAARSEAGDVGEPNAPGSRRPLVGADTGGQVPREARDDIPF